MKIKVNEVLEEVIADIVNNINEINSTIQNEYDRCPHGYTKEYCETFSKVTKLLTEENILKVLKD